MDGKIYLIHLAVIKLHGHLFRYVVDQVSSTGNLSQDDGENIKTIIEEGCKQKVDEMEIEMSRDVAIGLNVNGIEGVDVTFGSKGKTKYVMKIKYKYDN
ncbi:MAG: hypothetical protein HC899_14350 [Leptolyngbyaceae cyanobacterium SM1_4_3]|nr:hypothetical protein [Leptolyngbyaceae cyanobacterium SM1_4_3]NJN89825.1 hypothetical protein [Leptolyngbyaceae cyanobacterium SL_5_14]